MQFLVTDRQSIEEGIVVRSSYVLISIRDPDKSKAKIPKQSGLKDVLFTAFHDAEPVKQTALPADIKLMTAEQAKAIWEFVLQHDGKVGTVVVHCEQGMSRSPAVAAAFCKGLGGDDQRFFSEYQPNAYVYRLMLDAAPKAS
jgi:predicted protein tyrosine phosphatase